MIPPFRTKEQYDLMKSCESPAYSLPNILSKKEVKYLYDWYTENKHREFRAGQSPKDGKKKYKDNYNGKLKGNIRFPYAWEELKHILQSKVEEILGTNKFKFVSGRLYRVPKEHVWDSVHTDICNNLAKLGKDLKHIYSKEQIEKIEREGAPANNGRKCINWAKQNPKYIVIPWKTIVFPLWLNGLANTVSFNQYNYGVESVSWNKHLHRTIFPGSIAKYTEYMTDKMSITDEEYNKWLKHLTFPKSYLYGLSIQNVHEWKIGSVYVWDSAQLHVSGYQSDTEKIGLTIWTAHSDNSFS